MFWFRPTVALVRFEKLQDRSPICKKAYPILRHLQYVPLCQLSEIRGLAELTNCGPKPEHCSLRKAFNCLTPQNGPRQNQMPHDTVQTQESCPTSRVGMMPVLLLRGVHKSSKHNFRPESRSKCILSSTAMLDFHQQFCELPRLRSEGIADAHTAEE
jgi:hypothetical protein